MGEMRDSDWSRQNLLRSDWLGPSVASMTTEVVLVFIQKEELMGWHPSGATRTRNRVIGVNFIDF